MSKTNTNMELLLDDVINALANYRSLQGKNRDFLGCEVTTQLIAEVHQAITFLKDEDTPVIEVQELT